MKSLIVLCTVAVGGVPSLFVIAQVAEPILRRMAEVMHALGM